MSEFESAAYSRWIDAILETHATQSWNDADADSDDEHLNADWEILPESLRRRIWGLSADLFSLVDDEKFADADWGPISGRDLAKLQKKAFEERRWDDLLELLRRPPRYFPGDEVSYIRGRAWEGLGQHHVALKFFDNASRLNPGHTAYRILALESLKVSGAWQEALRRADQYGHDPASSPALLFRAGDIYFAYMMNQHENQEQLAQRAVDLIDLGLVRRNSPGFEPPLDEILVAAYLTKAYCLERQGRAEEMLKTYNLAIQQFPTNPELLTARGLVRLEHRMGNPIDDFRDAAYRAAKSVWPYLELARDHYSRQEYDKTIEFCQLGLDRGAQDADAALLHELRALALFARHESTATVESAFQNALSLDPFNMAIRHNHERFLSLTAHPDQPPGDDWERSPLPVEEVKRTVFRFVQSRIPQAA